MYYLYDPTLPRPAAGRTTVGEPRREARRYLTENESKLAMPLREVGAVPVLGT